MLGWRKHKLESRLPGEISITSETQMKQRYGRKWRGTVVLEKTLESPLVCKGIQPVHSEGDQPWDFFGRNDAKAETPVLWPPHAKSWLIGKDSDAGRDWGQEKKGTTEDEMASLTRWTWVWVNSGSWCWTGRPSGLRFMGLQSRTRLSDWSDLIWSDGDVMSMTMTNAKLFILVDALWPPSG